MHFGGVLCRGTCARIIIAATVSSFQQNQNTSIRSRAPSGLRHRMVQFFAIKHFCEDSCRSANSFQIHIIGIDATWNTRTGPATLALHSYHRLQPFSSSRKIPILFFQCSAATRLVFLLPAIGKRRPFHYSMVPGSSEIF